MTADIGRRKAYARRRIAEAANRFERREWRDQLARLTVLEWDTTAHRFDQGERNP